MDSLNTQLRERVLWYDGVSAFNPDNIIDLVSKYDVKYVTNESKAVCQYNKSVPKSQEILVKTECNPLSTDWNIPDEYKTLDIVQYVMDRHEILTKSMSGAEIDAREQRLAEELVKYQMFGLLDVLRTISWVINTLTTNDVVWGVGRGSSVSSYVLYVIGVHDVDSYLYALDIDDFLHR